MGKDVNLARKLAVQNVGCVFAYFCGGHKNNFPILFRSSFKENFGVYLHAKKSYLFLTSFLKYYKAIANLLLWVLWARLATPSTNL